MPRTAPSPLPSEFSTRVLRLRLKDKHAPWLRERAAEVNLVWNFCNELSHTHWSRKRVFLSAYDLQKYTDGATKEGLGLHSHTVQAVGQEYVLRRRQFKRTKLRWRVSFGPRRSLGWVPFKASALRYRNGQVFLGKQALSLWDSYGLGDYVLGAGSLSEDARGRWYLNVTVKVKKQVLPHSQGRPDALGIDLGLKDLVSDSSGTKVAAQQFYRGLEDALSRAQRAGKTGRVRSIHAKVAHRRGDHLHKLSTALVRTHQAIFVGNVNAQQLTQSRMAKSVLDAGWSKFRAMLQYKCDDAGVWFREVDERFSTQECSACAARTGPKGLVGLGVRRWTCSACLTEHDRDTNSARVIKARGLVWLEGEFSAAAARARGPAASVNEATGAQAPAVAAPGHGRPGVGIPVL